VCAHDFGDQGGGPQQAKFAADPGEAAAALLFVVGSLVEEDGVEIAIAEAMDSELAVVMPDRSARSSHYCGQLASGQGPSRAAERGSSGPADQKDATEEDRELRSGQ
jgi:hypothetical protein